VNYLKRVVRFCFRRVEYGFDRFFPPAVNPFGQLGSLGWFFYWIVAASGIYLYIFFDTGIVQAYESIEKITNVQWYAGGVMRSLHRYASDALVVVIVLHLLREFAHDRLRGKRWFAWLTGIPLLWFIYACGISGYWMVWDRLAQYIAIVTTEWLDTLPLFAESVAGNFLSSATLGGRFFSLMVFIHIAVPLFLLFLMWLHIQRHNDARINPPRALAAGTLSAMLVLALLFPAISQGPADLDTVPAVIDLDWFFLALYPLLDIIPGERLWLFVGAGTLLLLALPWLPPMQTPRVARVNLDNCNGCQRCVDDCPYSAIMMGPRTDGSPYASQPVVDPGNCVSCGICAGACPTATPFRRASALVPGIELPDFPIAVLRQQTVDTARQLSGTGRVLVYACEYAGGVDLSPDGGVGIIPLPCVGMLPPAFLDFVLSRGLADGIMISGCRPGDCHHRLGAEWTRQRIAGQRDPYLRKRVPAERIHQCWLGGDRRRRHGEELLEFRARLGEMDPGGQSAAAVESAGGDAVTAGGEAS